MLNSLKRNTGQILAALACANLVTVAVTYMVYPGYVDHGEPAIAAMATRLLAGLPVYLPFDAPEWITNLYGPVMYLWYAWPLALFGGSIAASKAAAALSAVMVVAVIALAVRRHPMAWWLIALGAVMMIIHLAYPVVIRPDSLVTVMVGVAVLAAIRGENSASLLPSVVIGLATALAVGNKIHAAIYLVPVALFHVYGDWRRLVAVAVVAVAGSALPFAFPAFPLHDYLTWFGPMAGKESSWEGFEKIWWKVSLYLLVPVAVWGAVRPLRLDRRVVIYFASYVLCLLLVLFPATKVGAGDQYYLPFLPLMIDLTRRSLVAGGTSGTQRLIVGASVILVIAASYQSERRFLKRLEWEKSRAVVTEIEAILADYKDRRIQMGVGRVPSDIGAQFSYYYYAWRSLPVFKGHPYTLDAGVAMEMTKLGIPFSPKTLQSLAVCDIQIWLIPKGGRPLALYGYYQQDVFGPEVLDTFDRHHRLIESRGFFDLWECHS